MAEYDMGNTTTTDMSSAVKDVTIGARVPDAQGAHTGEIVWDFPDSGKYLGYYKEIPELKSALHVLAQRVAGLGWTADNKTTVILKGIDGWGEDTFSSIMQQMVIEKKVFGDAFAEQIRTDSGQLLNLKKLYTGDMRIVMNTNGLIERYEQRSNIPGGKPKKFRPEQILHLCNDRIANEMHGTSVIESLKKIIDFHNELLSDERRIRHRELAAGILELDTDDPVKQAAAINKFVNAVNKGEALVTVKGASELKPNPISPRDRIQIMQYIKNYFYEVVGTPKVLVTSEGFTEAGGKAGLLAFEPTEISEKLELEGDLWNQLGKEIKFTRAPSLLGDAVGTETKNAGQTGIQQNETDVRPTRTE